MIGQREQRLRPHQAITQPPGQATHLCGLPTRRPAAVVVDPPQCYRLHFTPLRLSTIGMRPPRRPYIAREAQSEIRPIIDHGVLDPLHRDRCGVEGGPVLVVWAAFGPDRDRSRGSQPHHVLASSGRLSRTAAAEPRNSSQPQVEISRVVAADNRGSIRSRCPGRCPSRIGDAALRDIGRGPSSAVNGQSSATASRRSVSIRTSSRSPCSTFRTSDNDTPAFSASSR